MIEHSLGRVEGQEMDATLLHSDDIRCPMCPSGTGRQEITTTCGCTLDLMPCLTHVHAALHRHCQTCGVPVFFDEEAKAYDDHECPQGFISTDLRNLNPPGSCQKYADR